MIISRAMKVQSRSVIAKVSGAALVVGIACSACSKKPSDTAPKKPGSQEDRADAAKDESRFVARSDDIVDKAEYQGTVQAIERMELKSNKRLRVKKVHVKDNTRVKKGDLLIEVDQSDFEKKVKDLEGRLSTARIEIKAAELSFAQANKTLTNKTRLAAKGIVPEKELVEAKRSQIQAEVALKSKKLDIEKTEKELADAKVEVQSANIIATMDGTVSRVYRATGSGYDQISEGQTAAVIANDAKLGFIARIPDADAMRVAPGAPVEIVFESLGGGTANGVVVSVRPPALESRGSGGGYGGGYGDGGYGGDSGGKGGMDLVVDFTLPLPDGLKDKLRDGVSGSARIVWASKKGVVVIPVGALRKVGEKDMVLAADSKSGEAKPFDVEVGVRTRNEVEIVKGLKAGQVVLVEVAK